MVARSGDIILRGVCLLLHFVYRNGVDTPRQNDDMIRIVH